MPNPIIPPPESIQPGHTVWAYLRDSGGGAQDRSVEQQREIVLQICAERGFVLEHLFEDIGISGKSMEGRTDLDQILSITANPERRPRALLLWNFARFARDTNDSLIYIGILRKRGLIVHSLTNYVPEGPMAPVIETLIHVADEQKRAEAAAGAWRGLHHVVRQGAVPGTPPRGFMREPITVTSDRGVQRTAHRWIPDPEVVPRVQRAFEMRAQGRTLKEIKDETRLYNDINSYITFFKNRLYIGTLVYGEAEYPDYCKPVIDQKTWATVQEITAQSAQRQTSTGPNQSRRKTSSLLLSGLVYCARCGSPLYGHISPQRGKFDPARAYRCTRATRTRECDLPRIPAHALEHAILDELASLAHQPEYIEKMREIAAKRTAAAAQKTDTQRATLRAELKSMRAKLTNVANAIENGGHSATLLKRLNELETQQTRLQNQLNLLQTKPDELPPAESAQIQRVFAQAANIIQNASVADGQTILRGMVEKIATDRSEKHLTIDIELRLPKKKVM